MQKCVKEIRERHGKHYLVKRSKEDGRWRESWTPLNQASKNNLLAAVNVKNQLREEVVKVPCMNPSCSQEVLMTPQQKQDLLISFKKKYDKFVLVCCSKECQQNVFRLLQNKN